MAKELTGRLAALGRAHDLARPLPGSQGRAALLGDLISVLRSPYEDLGAFSGRIRVAVPADRETPRRLHCGSTTGTDLELVWLEGGGPKLEPSAAADVMEASLSDEVSLATLEERSTINGRRRVSS